MLDIDAHHGNGTQAIFYEDPEVLTGSVHVDPGAGWFPHFLGFAAETGGGRGRRRQPQPAAWRRAPATRPWLEAVAELAAWARDARGRGPGRRARRRRRRRRSREPAARSPPHGFRAAGRALGALGLPTVVVQEGGYDLAAIGLLVGEALTGIEQGLDR